jgi:hypothetical protein
MRRASGSGWSGEKVKAGLIAMEWLKTGGRGHKALAGNGRNRVALDQRAGIWSPQTKAMANL